jgi:hypothetical protein
MIEDEVITSSSADLDMERSDAEFFALGGDVLGSQHGSVGRGLVTVRFHLHAAGDAADGFATGEISHVDEGVILYQPGSD